MTLEDLYGAFGEIEQLPVDAQAAEQQAGLSHKKALGGLDARAIRIREAAQAASARTTEAVRAAAQSASSRGVIAKPGIQGTGREPNFASVKALDTALAGLLSQQDRAAALLARTREELRRMEQLVGEEVRRARLRQKARTADRVTLLLAAVVALLAVYGGPNVFGAAAVVVGLLAVGVRLHRGPSGWMMQAADRRPFLEAVPAARRAFVLSRVALAAAGVLLSAYLLNVGLSRHVPLDGVFGTDRASADAAWFGAVVASLALSAGSLDWLRRAGSTLFLS